MPAAASALRRARASNAARVGVIAVRDDAGRNAGACRARSRPAGIGAVGDDQRDLGGKFRRGAGSISACRLEPRPEIEDARPSAGPRSLRRRVSSVPGAPVGRGDDAADAIDALARRREARVTAAPPSGATIATMPMPQLKVRAISRAGDAARPREPARTPAAAASCRASISAASTFGQHARDVLDEPAAGDMRQRLDAARRDRARQLLT